MKHVRPRDQDDDGEAGKREQLFPLQQAFNL
jgi:hypothetical protein